MTTERVSLSEMRIKARRAAGFRKQWDTRRAAMRETTTMHCVCTNPKPFKDGLGLRLFGTVECGRCHRVIFVDGKAVRS